MPNKSFSIGKYIQRSLRHYWRVQTAVLLASAVAVAVLTGSLLVGDSMRHSLRSIVLEALGGVEHALVYDLFFPEDLAERVEREQADSRVEGVILLQGGATHADQLSRAGRIQVLGVDSGFWSFGEAIVDWEKVEPWQTVVNARLAGELGADAGDDLILRVPKPSAIPRESFLGEKDDTVITLRLTIAAVLPDEGLGRFSLSPSQQSPLNLFLRREVLQDRLNRPDQVNTLLASGDRLGVEKALNTRARMEDAGLAPREVGPFVSLESRRVFLGDSDLALAEKAAGALAESYKADAAKVGSARPDHVLTYLANQIASGDRVVPYSMAAAVASADLADDEIYLNQWTADELGARVGAKVALTYYTPGEGGALLEETTTFTLKGILPVEAALFDRAVTPHIEGITDADTVSSWNPPFPMDLKRIRPQDEAYWDEYRARPKCLISFATAVRLWGNRHGEQTALVWDGSVAGDLRRELDAHFQADEAGLRWMAVREDGLKASSGTTDFGGLFIGFSLFLLVSSVALLQALFRLGIEGRSKELGLLLAVGYPISRARRLLLLEGGLVAGLGGLLGLGLGVLYAMLLVYGLNNWWVGSIGGSFLRFHAGPTSLGMGFLGGWLVAALAMWNATRLLGRVSDRALLAGRTEQCDAGDSRRRASLIVGVVGVLAGLILLIPASWQPAHSQATFFFIVGALLLIGMIALFRHWLAGDTSRSPLGLTLGKLGASNTKRQPGRSLMVMALIASATFLIVAVGANRQTPTKGNSKDSGSGGFALLGESTIPFQRDPMLMDWRDRDGLKKVEDLATIHAMRLRPGDDISCLNLFKSSRPRVVGVGEDFIERGGFLFSGVLDAEAFLPGSVGEAEQANPWLLLNRPLADGSIPAIGDYTTVYWLLHSGLGKSLDLDGRRLTIVGLLQKSVFQSELLIGDAAFQKAFPEIGGWSVFAVDAPLDQTENVTKILEAEFEPHGLDMISAPEKLAALMKVENTYLSAFMSLGGLGLLLGTVGLALALLRNLMERRREFALFSALGFRFRQRMWLALSENGFLLAAGMAVGVLGALFSVLPSLYSRSARVPWGSLALVLLGVYVFGLVAAWIGASMALRAPALNGLKEE